MRSRSTRRQQPDRVASTLGQAGLVVRAQLLREPDEDGNFTETTQQAFLLARKPAGAGHPAARKPSYRS
jgi:hypothetical protein